jgi:hypothetical protein
LVLLVLVLLLPAMGICLDGVPDQVIDQEHDHKKKDDLSPLGEIEVFDG